jgi:O-antigen/teichoic acid export membrane protein
VQFVVRGLLIGQRLLASHGLVQLVDATLRLALAGIAVLVISPDSTTFAWTVVCAIALAHLPLLPGLIRRAIRTRASARPEPALGPRSFAAAVAPLLLASVSGQLLLNGMPVLVSALAPQGEQDRAGQFIAAFLLTRLPLLVVVALQTALIPLFVKVATDLARSALARLLAQLTGLVAALGLVGSLAALTVGPALLELVFGTQYRLPGTDLAMLTAGVSAHIGLLITTQALIAFGMQRHVGMSWLACLVAAVGTFLLTPDLLFGAELGFLVGSASGWILGTMQILSYGARKEVANAR